MSASVAVHLSDKTEAASILLETPASLGKRLPQSRKPDNKTSTMRRQQAATLYGGGLPASDRRFERHEKLQDLLRFAPFSSSLPDHIPGSARESSPHTDTCLESLRERNAPGATWRYFSDDSMLVTRRQGISAGRVFGPARKCRHRCSRWLHQRRLDAGARARKASSIHKTCPAEAGIAKEMTPGERYGNACDFACSAPLLVRQMDAAGGMLPEGCRRTPRPEGGRQRETRGRSREDARWPEMPRSNRTASEPESCDGEGTGSRTAVLTILPTDSLPNEAEMAGSNQYPKLHPLRQAVLASDIHERLAIFEWVSLRLRESPAGRALEVSPQLHDFYEERYLCSKGQRRWTGEPTYVGERASPERPSALPSDLSDGESLRKFLHNHSDGIEVFRSDFQYFVSIESRDRFEAWGNAVADEISECLLSEGGGDSTVPPLPSLHSLRRVGIEQSDGGDNGGVGANSSSARATWNASRQEEHLSDSDPSVLSLNSPRMASAQDDVAWEADGVSSGASVCTLSDTEDAMGVASTGAQADVGKAGSAATKKGHQRVKRG